MAEQSAWRRADIWLLGGLILVAVALRLLALWATDLPLESDALQYFTMAKNLHEGRGLIDGYGQRAYMNAGYPIFLASLWQVSGVSIPVAKLANLALAAGTVALVYRTTLYLCARYEPWASRGLWPSRVAAALAGLAWALFIEAASNGTMLHKEDLMSFVLMVQLLLVARHALGTRQRMLCILLGLAIGAETLVGNAALAIVPALLRQLHLQSGAWRETIRQYAIVVLASAVIVVPWMARNYAVLGHPVINTNSGFNLYLGNNANSDGHYINIADTPLGDVRFHELWNERGEYGTSQELTRLAIEYMLDNPWRAVTVDLRKGVYFWSPPHTAPTGDGHGEVMARWVNYAQFWLLLVPFVAFSVWMARRQPRMLFLVGAVLLYTAVHMIFYPFPRYRIPIIPILCIGLGLSVSLSMLHLWLGDRWQPSRA